MFNKKTSGYSKALSEYGESPKSLQWNNYASAAIRYRQIVADLDLDGKSILDIGCGMGDILPYIYSKAPNFEYLGVDRNEDFINIAKKRYEGHNFRVFDPFKENLGQTFDVVILCGAMNANKPNWLENRKQKIHQIYSLADKAVAFNMAGALQPIKSQSRVAYADVQEIVEFCANLTPRLIVKTHYHPKDFTVLIFK